MSGNQVEPPRKWPFMKRARAFFNYDVKTCDYCGKIIQVGVWAFRNPRGGIDTCLCERCYDRLEGVRQ